jgi:nucleoside-diphosphate-sugar epimerase
MVKRVLLTGATGLIGKETIIPLKKAGFDIFAISRIAQAAIPSLEENGVYCQVDLFNEKDLERFVRKIKPIYLLHFAWYTQENYLTSDINYQLKDASLNLLRIFKKYGGKRAVYAGTCSEYEFKDAPIKEDDPLNLMSVYAQCKNELREKAEQFARENDISFGWGRIFYVFGHREYKNRLVPDIVDSLRDNRKVVIRSGPLIRDYMYSRDIAGAFVKLLDADITGSVNICSGEGISIKDFASKIAEKLGKIELLDFTDGVQNQPPVIIGNNTRLIKDVGYCPYYTMDAALENILYEQDSYGK